MKYKIKIEKFIFIKDLEDFLDDTCFNQVDENLKDELFNVLGEDVNCNGWEGIDD